MLSENPNSPYVYEYMSDAWSSLVCTIVDVEAMSDITWAR